MMEKYSVLMTVYHKEDPKQFVTAIRSMLDQTVTSDDIVIVCDGPLTEELDRALDEFRQQNPGVFNIVRLEENVGIGAAANIGLQHCRYDLVAKMDADDIAVPERCEMQLRRFDECPELKVLGGHIEEFGDDPAVPFSVRKVPLSNEQIRKFARRRQPFNNMTVMYRRCAVQAVGGYRDFRRSEDFDLYLRLLAAGNYAENLDRVLVKARVNEGAFQRRGSWATLCGCARSRWYSYKIGYASLTDVCVCVAGELVIMLSPHGVKKFIYSHFLRK